MDDQQGKKESLIVIVCIYCDISVFVFVQKKRACVYLIT